MPIRAEPLTAPTPEAILVGDPRRAFTLAQAFTEDSRMSHLARGLWGYVGKTPDGRGLTVQSTGAGGSAATAVMSDLAGAGVSTLVRMGTCEVVADGPEAGQILLVEEALAFDGASLSLSGADRPGAIVPPDRDLTGRIGRELGDSILEATVSSHDLVARLERNPTQPPPGVARDLQTAAVLAVARELGVRAAALLIVVEDRRGKRLTESEVEEGFIALWPGVATALGKV